MTEFFLMQLFGAGDGIIGQILYFAMFFVFIFFYPRLMITQTLWKLEKDVADLDMLAEESLEMVINKIPKGKKSREDVERFMNFFAVSPVNLDPSGIIRKLELVIRHSDKRFLMFAQKLAPRGNEVEIYNIKTGLAGAMTTHQIAKVVKHMVKVVKKYKIFQMAIILQMQIPIIKDMARAAKDATEAFVEGNPIGDGVGPLVAAELIPAKVKPTVYKDDDFSVAKVKINGRNVWVSKASGPGSTTGYPGTFLKKFFKRNKVDRIITVDAAMRMESEEIGSVSQGVGIAMGGSGVDRFDIENIAVQYGLPLDAVAIKVNQAEALGPMRKAVLDAVPEAIERVEELISEGKKSERILIIGVGNTCGVVNSSKGLDEVKKNIRKVDKAFEKRREAEKKKGFFG